MLRLASNRLLKVWLLKDRTLISQHSRGFKPWYVATKPNIQGRDSNISKRPHSLKTSHVKTTKESTWSDSYNRSWYGVCLRNELHCRSSFATLFGKRCILANESLVWEVSTERNLSRRFIRDVQTLFHLWLIALKVHSWCKLTFLEARYQDWDVSLWLDHFVSVFLYSFVPSIGILWLILCVGMVFLPLNGFSNNKVFRIRDSWWIWHANDTHFH